MKEILSYFFLVFGSFLVISGQSGPTQIQDCKKFGKTCTVTDQHWARANNVTVYGKQVYATFYKCSFPSTDSGAQQEYCINNDPLDACQKTNCSYICDKNPRTKEITGVESSWEDCNQVVHVGGFDCQTCRPSPTPTPSAGACGGFADYTTYPTTGCSSGLTLVDNWCDLSLAEQDSCNGPTFYDWDSCSCPDGYPTPTPPPCDMGFCDAGYHWDLDLCDCEPNSSPILIDVSGNGFDLTNLANGVTFDINGSGLPVQVGWTTSDSDDAWLAVDRNGNNFIDDGSELFGDTTPQPPLAQGEKQNGFRALAEFDKPANGGNGDGKISIQDSVFSSLRLWRDVNHNGVSEPDELHALSELGLASIDLDYKESKRVDRYGNQFRYRAKVKDVHGAQIGRWAWDVFLVH